MHIVDSMIARYQIQKESYGFQTFVARMVAEIQSKSESSDEVWVAGDQNVADMTTCVSKPGELGSTSKWQQGPDIFRRPIEQWHISKDCNIEATELPDRVGTILSSVSDMLPSYAESSMDLHEFLGH